MNMRELVMKLTGPGPSTPAEKEEGTHSSGVSGSLKICQIERGWEMIVKGSF